MAEDPTFSGLGSPDAISAAAAAIAGIKSDMADIERSAKKTADSMSKMGTATVSTGAGSGRGGGSVSGRSADGSTTGSAEPAAPGSALGKITQAVGGPMAAIGFGMAGAGAIVSGMGGGFGLPDAGMPTAALAIGGFRDLRVRPDEALNLESARLRSRMGTGTFSGFESALNAAARQSAVIQDQGQLTQSLGTLTGTYGLGLQQAAGEMGTFNTLAGLAGTDQSLIPGQYAQTYGAPAFYGSLAAGVTTRTPTGEPVGLHNIINQLYAQTYRGMTPEQAAEEIRRERQPGSATRAQLRGMGFDEATAQQIIEGLAITAESGGQPLTEERLAERTLELSDEEGATIGEEAEGMLSATEVERTRAELVTEYYDNTIDGLSRMNEEISKAQEYLSDLEGPARTAAEAATALAAALDTAASKMPKTVDSVNTAMSGFGDLLSSAIGTLGGLLMGKGLLKGGGGLLGKIFGKGGGGGGSGLMAGVRSTGGGVLRAASRLLPQVGAALGLNWAIDKVAPDLDASNPLIKAFPFLNEAFNPDEGASFWDQLGAVVSSAVSNEGWYARGEREREEREGRSKGDWFVEKDQVSQIHYGEMVVPARIAQAVRDELNMGQVSPIAGERRGQQPTKVDIHLTVQHASDAEAMRFAKTVKRVIDGDHELASIGMGRLA